MVPEGSLLHPFYTISIPFPYFTQVFSIHKSECMVLFQTQQGDFDRRVGGKVTILFLYFILVLAFVSHGSNCMVLLQPQQVGDFDNRKGDQMWLAMKILLLAEYI